MARIARWTAITAAYALFLALLAAISYGDIPVVQWLYDHLSMSGGPAQAVWNWFTNPRVVACR